MQHGYGEVTLGFCFGLCKTERLVLDVLTICIVNGRHFMARERNCSTENHFLLGGDLPVHSVLVFVRRKTERLVLDVLNICVVNRRHFMAKGSNCSTENHFLLGDDLPVHSVDES